MVVGWVEVGFLYAITASLESGETVASGVWGLSVTAALVGLRTRQKIDLCVTGTTVRAKLMCRSDRDDSGLSNQGPLQRGGSLLTRTGKISSDCGGIWTARVERATFSGS